jgi:hypothetical protein
MRSGSGEFRILGPVPVPAELFLFRILVTTIIFL